MVMIIENATPSASGQDATRPSPQPDPSPALLFDTINAYQRTAAIKAGIELDVFTAVADGPANAPTIANRCSASPRGIRILCDNLVVLGFLTKSGEHYALTMDSAVFLSRKSPAYAGGTLQFLLSDDLRGGFERLTESVRKGGTAQSAEGTIAPEHQVWISFARSMGPLMAPAAAGLADLIPLDQSRPSKVLDISASHGMWGIEFAKKNPRSHLVALDWATVLEVSLENARASGLEARFSTIAGSAFDVDLGTGYDVILVPNFLHHFNPADCVRFLKRAHAALRPGGTVAIVEFVPGSDRVTPPGPASFSIVMLATTPQGDAYTFAEYSDMLAQAGFAPPTQQSLPASMNVAVIAKSS
ncbi:MAG: Methyltransferase type 12 [Verrucomicrobiales bacterium]|nr:Methyltransferase type 12 [Verrucomicrobiales bacterium]